MRFYDREQELMIIEEIHNESHKSSKMLVITGRRRIGKTRLIQTALQDKKYLYFFISRKSEALLCEEFVQMAVSEIGLTVIGKISRLSELFTLLFAFAKDRQLTVVIDEFQELLSVSPHFISELQGLWDKNKNSSKLMLIVSGSVYSLLNRMFMSAKEPLFGRAELIMRLGAFPVKTLAKILDDAGQLHEQNLLTLYMVCGGIPRYVELMTDSDCLERSKLINRIFGVYSPFIEEGKNLLIEEFGKDYSIYFSILELIARGKTSRPEVESILEKSTGAYLERLETDYNLISVFRPLNAKSGSRTIRYKLNDPFIAFWFAWFYRYRSALEANNLAYIQKQYLENAPTYSGYWLQRLYQDLYLQSGKFTQVGSWWEKGFYNEVDLVAVDDLKKEVILAEIKLKKANIRISHLKLKAENLISQYPDFKPVFKALSAENLLEDLRKW